ncbi:MAG: sulfatase [Anaerolineae bacterium]|nr:sulfatase [Anaerolineae bacterium]
MKAIMVMYDSLNRHFLPRYGCDWVHAPNFTRLARRSVTFDNCYVGSMPTIPARREIHTGRYNFLHRSWGPLEPFDDSMPEILRDHGIYTHLVSDNGHYWEDGGCTYHQRYNTWENTRGQEGDKWKGHVKDPVVAESVGRASDGLSKGSGGLWRQDWVNRNYMQREEDQPQYKTFAHGLDFIRTNNKEDNWFVQIETFDPHEPFYTQPKYQALYPHEYTGPHFDWPPYARVTETPEQVQHCRCLCAALVSMCDSHLGKVLDAMDELDLWKDTLLIVNTDHGTLLGEHGWWAKAIQPFYSELALTPLFIWDPRSARHGARCPSLVQTIDLAPTLLEFFGVERPPDMQGVPLRETLADDRTVREAALFGMHGAHVNCTDGRYVYMRASADAQNQPLYDYTLMPTRMRSRFSPSSFGDLELAPAFAFTKSCQLMKIKAESWISSYDFGSLLFDLSTDPGQAQPLQDPAAEEKMISHMVRLMKESNAPAEQYERLGLKR